MILDAAYVMASIFAVGAIAYLLIVLSIDTWRSR